MAFSRDLMLGMLRRGSNGAEINQILELIVAELQSANSSDNSQVESVEA